MLEDKKKIISYGFELLIIIVSILFASYAWFNKNKEIKANDLYIKTDSHLDLLVSLDGVNWSNETTINISDNFKFKNEITGNGIDFFVSSIKRDDGTPVSFKQATKNKDYLEFDIWFKLSGTGAIFLEDGSYVNPSVGIATSDLVGPTVERISSSGNFSRDLVASSVRLAFIDNNFVNNQYSTKSEASLVWAPNKQYEITCDKYCTVNLNSNSVQDYRYIDASDSSNYKNSIVRNLKDVISASVENNNANGDPMLTYVGNDTEIKKVTVRIWIEGNDRDNVTALTGGIFTMNLNFTAISKQFDSSAPNVSINNNSLVGFDETMEYSKDYGVNWIKYNDNSNPTFDIGTTVYVRRSEQKTVFASNYKELKFEEGEL